MDHAQMITKLTHMRRALARSLKDGCDIEGLLAKALSSVTYAVARLLLYTDKKLIHECKPEEDEDEEEEDEDDGEEEDDEEGNGSNDDDDSDDDDSTEDDDDDEEPVVSAKQKKAKH